MSCRWVATVFTTLKVRSLCFDFECLVLRNPLCCVTCGIAFLLDVVLAGFLIIDFVVSLKELLSLCRVVVLVTIVWMITTKKMILMILTQMMITRVRIVLIIMISMMIKSMVIILIIMIVKVIA